MKKMKRRFLALLLCVAMLLNVSPTIPAQASSSELLTVMYDGDPVDSVVLPVNERIKLKADRALLGSGTYQWQILAYDTIWVDIAGAEGKTVEISYAMIASLLENDEAVIRCKVTKGENVTYSSEVVVMVDYDVATDSNATEIAIEIEEESSSNTSIASDSDADEDDEEEETTEPVKVSRVFSLLSRAIESNTYVATPLNDDDTTTPTTYNVVINYLFENNEIVADPYTANLAAGSDFTATVTFPKVQGYLPYVNEVQKDKIELKYTAIDQDYTINVVYKPTNVNYTVIHYQQNLDNDNYTEVARETKQGLTNSTVPEVAKDYDGFYALLYEKPAIAADGSTVVEIYYDRYYYLMNFDLGGGYGVEPIYARYGAPIGNVGTPKLTGYSFEGWSLDGTTSVDLPTEMPNQNRTYHAVWKADDTAKVTIVFWGENADDEEYSYIKSSTVNVKPGTKFTYSENGSLICSLEVHTHDASCQCLCGQEEHEHSIENGCYELTCTQTPHNHATDGCTLNCNHVHTTKCYKTGDLDYYDLVETNKPSQKLTDKGNGIYTYTTGSGRNQQTHYYLNIGDKWYCAERWFGGGGDTTEISFNCTHTHTDSCYTCGLTETTHDHSIEAGCYELICEKAEHTHSDACGYSCGKVEHTHNSDCYMNGAGLDSNLWTFVRSDTVTIAADGSSVVNVYYDRTEKTLTFKYNYSNNNKNYQSTETITAKWGSDISEQYKKITANAGSTFWSAQTSGASPYTNYFGVMPQTSATYYNRGATGSDGTMTYLGQDLNGEYTVKLFEVTGVGGYTVTDEDRYEFKGFTYDHGTSNDSSCSGATFYYTRNSYTLTFNDGYNDVKTESVKYEAPLSTYSSCVPDVPVAYEPNSVTFGGWYLNPECSGAEYKLDDHTMPADNVLLYAKWVPVTHTVQFYLDKEALDTGTKLSTHPDITVPHGSNAEPAPADPVNGSYTFVGWFYMEGGVEKAFDFANMPVTKDLQVYGKWSSNVLKEYTIYYKYMDGSSNEEIEIAAPTTGSGLAGITKTFDAKGGTELYAVYQEGYFPLVKSHSMTLDINATEENDTNVYTFWYVQKEAVPYTVKYLNKETGEPVADEKTVSENRKAVVTETFVPVSGMMPDAYQKRLVVSAEEGAVNEIIFYYTEDTVHAYYKITHYTENVAEDVQGNTTWTEYASSTAIGDIGKTYSADPMTIPGFTYDSAVEGTVASGELTASGLELKLYYIRNSYPYQVRYLESGTDKQLEDPKDGTAKYGEIISESAVDIDNYDALDPTSVTLSIAIEDSNTANVNVITFYYERLATITYEVVGPAGSGTVDRSNETVRVFTGAAAGSTASAAEKYRFVGWFKDKDCQQPVDSEWITGTTIKPKQVTNYGSVDEEKMGYSDVTYYAKFERDVANLTIVKKGANTTLDEDQVFVFTVESVTDNTFKRTVTIKGNGSVALKDLPSDVYEVTEDSSWSWRYQPSYKAGAIGATDLEEGNIADLTKGDGQVVVTNKRNNESWLDGNAYCKNIFTVTDEGVSIQNN